MFLADEFQVNIANEVKDEYRPGETSERHNRRRILQIEADLV